MFIYLIINHITGKYYVGQHKGDNLKQYLQQKFYEAEHRLSARSRLYASIRKHGRAAFTIHALVSSIQTRPELDQIEKEFIAFLRSQDPEYGYNICRGGEGFSGPHSEEARKKNSIASRAMWEQPGKRDRIVSNMKKVDGKYRAPGGLAGGTWAVESGQIDKIRPLAWAASAQWKKDHREEHLVIARKAGRKAVESGQLAKARTQKSCALGGQVAACKRWNIARQKPCACGNHK